MDPPAAKTAVQISALSLWEAPASDRFVHVREGVLDTLQFIGAASAVVANTSNAPAGTPVNAWDCAPTPVLVVKLLIVNVLGGGGVSVPVVNDQL